MVTPIHKELHRVAITGIIWKKDDVGVVRYLLAKRSPTKKVWPNKWHAPGGGLEVDDYINSEGSYANTESPQWYNSVEKALTREIQEEVGLTVIDPRYLLSVTFIRPDGIPVLVLSFYCKYESGEIAYDEDTVDSAWVTAEEAKSYDLIQGIDHEIKLVDERLKSE